MDSGSDRPELRKLISCLAHEDIVMVASLERFLRSSARLMRILDSIADAGAQCHALDLDVDDIASRGSRLVLFALGIMSEYEAKQIEDIDGQET